MAESKQQFKDFENKIKALEATNQE